MSSPFWGELPTIYVVDPDRRTAIAIRRLAHDRHVDVESHDSLAGMLQGAVGDPVGCLVVDLEAMELTATELFVRLAGKRIHMPVIVISSRCDVPSVVRALKAGALNYLQKPCDAELLVEAVEEAMAYDVDHHHVRLDDARCRRRLAALTPDQRRLLTMLVQGMSNKDIAFELGISVRTVEFRRAKLTAKMKAQGLADLVRQAVNGGLAGNRPLC